MKKIIFVLILISFADFSEAQWVQLNGVSYASSLVKSGSNIIASETYGVYLSTNNGNNWTYTACNGTEFNSLAGIGNNVFAGAVYGGVFMSTNSGINWLQTPQNSMSISYLAKNSTYLFAGGGNSGAAFYRSSNNGINWIGMFTGSFVPYAVAAKDSSVFISFVDNTMFNNFIYRSLNNGTSWTELSTGLPDPNEIITCFGFSNTTVYAGCSAGVYCSTNNGTSWYQTSLNNREVHCFAITGNNVFASTIYGVYLSINNGTNWTLKDEGFNGDPGVGALLIANNYIFASSSGIWRRPLSDMIIDEVNPNSNVPDKFYLYQNYPNPFNPSTIIRYQIKDSRFVTLKVYDVRGREIETLVNEKQNAGTYEVEFDAGNLPSGAYFYRMNSGLFSDTKKLMVIK
jgi:hypothetical protein